MGKSFINITDIFLKQKGILQKEPKNKWYFLQLPIMLGFVCSLLFYKDTKSILNILSLFLSIFIPLFISLLATIISFVMNKIKTRHNKERIPLIKETFYNICYLIPISVFLLVLSLLMSLTLGDNCILYKYDFNVPFCGNCYTIQLTVHFLYIFVIGILFYGGIIHLVMNILMVTKRIFVLFDKEIDLLKNLNPDKNPHQNSEEDDEDEDVIIRSNDN